MNSPDISSHSIDERPFTAPVTPVPTQAPANLPKLCSRKLFGTARELLIEHRGECYRLRLTRNGKLILTK